MSENDDAEAQEVLATVEQTLLLDGAGVVGSKSIVVDVGLRNSLIIMLVSLVEAEVRKVFEERKLADPKVVFGRDSG